MIQAIFFDIDGTLISFKTHAIPQSTIDAIKAVKAKGIKVIIATGRSLCDINGLEDLEFDGFITANGAYCITPDNAVVFQNLIAKDNLEALLRYQKEKPFPCVLMTDKGNFANYIDDRVMVLYNMVNIPVPSIKPLEEAVQYNVYQIDAFVDEQEEKEILETALTKCEGARWHPAFTDINVLNNSKSTGIDKFIEHFGFKLEETMAFGDGGNDITMLRHAGIGIAMDNAGDPVKAVADYVTTSVDDDGIVNALKHFKVL